MTAPYRVGVPAVFLELDDDGLRASQVAVLRVEPVGNAWGVETTLGRDVVNEHGEGGRIVPMDAELAQEFAECGSSFVARSTLHDIEKDLDPSIDWCRFEYDLDRDGSDRNCGPER